MVIQTDYSTPAAALGRRAHSHREALSLAAFLIDTCWAGRAPEPQAQLLVLRRRFVGRPSIYAWSGLHAYIEGIMTIHLR